MIELKSMVAEVEMKSYSRETQIHRIKISQSQDAEQYFRKLWKEDINVRESFYVLFLNRANNTIKFTCLSNGGINGTVIDVRLIAKHALDCLASGVIIAHNHPSGEISPSHSDLKITEKIYQGLKLLDIQLLDHIILTEDRYLSFSDEGKMDYGDE